LKGKTIGGTTFLPASVYGHSFHTRALKYARSFLTKLLYPCSICKVLHLV